VTVRSLVPVEPPDAPWHGTTSGYDYHKCGCAACRRVKRQGNKRSRDKARGKLAADDPRHGTTTGYQYWRCRCDPCVRTWNNYMKDGYHRRKGSKDN
jgi:hypothetical protein